MTTRRQPFQLASHCLLAAVVLASLFPSETVGSGQPLDLIDSQTGSLSWQNCSEKPSDNATIVAVPGNAGVASLLISLADWQTAGPVALEMEMKTDVPGELGEYLVYSKCRDEQRAGSNFTRIPFRPDGQWHTYRLPLTSQGILESLRFSWGQQPHQLELQDVRLVPIPEVLPEETARRQANLPPAVALSRGTLELSLDCRAAVFRVHDQATGRNWRSQPITPWLTLSDVQQTTLHTLDLELFDRLYKQHLTARVSLAEDGSVRFSLAPDDPEQPLGGAALFPPRFRTDFQDGQLVFCNRSCGVLTDQHDAAFAHWPLRVYGNTHCLDMPWVGVYDDRMGDAVMLLVETPADAEVALVADDAGRHWPEVRWLDALDRFRYPRVASLWFLPQEKYVGLAKTYRKYLKRKGQFTTLREKAEQKPLVERLRGAAILWGGPESAPLVHRLYTLGVSKGIVNGCRDPETIAQLNELGYLTGRYDSYTDILEGKPGFQRDNIAQTAIHSRPGSGPKQGWKLRDGPQMYWRSSALWEAAAASYVPAELQRLPYTARFIDVAAAADLLEDYHPRHTFDRRQDLIYRRTLLQSMNEHRLVLGTEHGNDWVVDQVEYMEGAMSGPFWWSSWPAGYLDRPRRDQLSPEYLKYGMGYAHRLPLWELVYHDCVVSTWYWGDAAGMLHEGAPELADQKDLFNLLYGTPPLAWLNGKGHRLPDELPRLLRTLHDTCRFHQEVAFAELVEHELLSDDRALQRSTFDNGAVVVVNFSDQPRRYDTGRLSVTLAPRGYWARRGNFRQSKLWIDNAVQIVAVGPGYRTVDGDGTRSIEHIRCRGRVTAFKTAPRRWGLFCDPGCNGEVNISGLTGWPTSDRLLVYQLDDQGRLATLVGKADKQGKATFHASTTSWQFALIRATSDASVEEKREIRPVDNE